MSEKRTEEDDDGGGGPSSPRVVRASSTVVRSVRTTTTTTRVVVRDGSGVRVVRTSASASSATTATASSASSSDEEEMRAIHSSLEEVAAVASSSSRRGGSSLGGRAGFESVADALGTLRGRLRRLARHREHREHRERGGGGWIQRLTERLRVVDAAHAARVPLDVLEGHRRRSSAPDLRSTARAGAGDDYDRDDGDDGAARPRRATQAAAAPPPYASATIFRVETRETTALHREERIDDGGGAQAGAAAGRPAPPLRRRSSILFASRVAVHRSIAEGSSRTLLASGGDGAIVSRREILGASGPLRHGSGGSLVDLDLHVHPSISRRPLPPPAADAGATVVGSAAIAAGGEMEVDPPPEGGDAMEVDAPPEPEEAVEADAAESGLYSWGRGEQSLHDDAEDRVPTLGGDREKENAHLMQVTSRLESKSMLHSACATYQSACATSRGTLYVAGRNVRGCVDPDSPEGEVISRPVLLDCLGNVRVVQVSCGHDHTAALSSNGSVLAWGSNARGQLGHRVGGVAPQKDPSSSAAADDFRGPACCRPTGMSLGRGRRASSIACGTDYTLVLTHHMSLLACGKSAIAGHREADRWGECPVRRRRSIPSH